MRRVRRCGFHVPASPAPHLGRRGGFRVAAAHYNHNLRGAESDRDAAFVAEWCAGQDIPCVIGGRRGP
ncbi:MAG: hypothetical protein ACLRIS_07230 [Flavonifractor plautii]